MTLAVAIQAADGIVVAADSRSMVGDPRVMTVVNDTVNKIFTPNQRVAIAMSGVADTGNALMQQMHPNLAAQPATDVDQAANAIRVVGMQTLNLWFGAPQYLMGPHGAPVPTPRPDVIFLLAGYTAAGQPKIITQANAPQFNFAPNLSMTGFSAIGIVMLAGYHLNSLYEPGMSLRIAKDLAAYCILETASHDGRVGGPIRMAIVRHNRDTEILTGAQIADLDGRVVRHKRALKTSFLTMDDNQPGAAPQARAPGAGK